MTNDLLHPRGSAKKENGQERATLDCDKTAEIVKEVLSSLPRQHRNVLVDLFYFKLSLDETCKKHKVAREQLPLILFHARRIFQQMVNGSI
jgi:hypothetical protein